MSQRHCHFTRSNYKPDDKLSYQPLRHERQHSSKPYEKPKEEKKEFKLDRSQSNLIRKINIYLALMNKPLLNTGGQCNGINLYWLRMMARREEKKYYSLIDQIAACPDDRILEVEKEIEIFVAAVNRGQQPGEYIQKDVTPNHLEIIITKAEKKDSITGRFSHATLLSHIKRLTKDHHMVNGYCKTGSKNEKGEYVCHAVALFNRDGQIYFLNSNSQTGRAVKVSADDILPNLFSAMYKDFKQPIPNNIHATFCSAIPESVSRSMKKASLSGSGSSKFFSNSSSSSAASIPSTKIRLTRN